MGSPIKRALTRKRLERGRLIVDEPDEKLLYLVEFAIGMTTCLSALEIASMAFLGFWNSEIFASITGLSGIVIGVFIGRKT